MPDREEKPFITVNFKAIHSIERMHLLFQQFCKSLFSPRNRSIERRINDGYGFESFFRDIFSYYLEDKKNYFNKTCPQEMHEAFSIAKCCHYEGFVGREVMYKDIMGLAKDSLGTKRADLCIWNKKDNILHIVELKILSDSSITTVIADLTKLDLLKHSCAVPCTKVFWSIALCKETGKKSSVNKLKKLKGVGWTLASVNDFGNISVVMLRRSLLY
jgi:hypothetical protein